MHKLARSIKTKLGFTLIELMIVVAIIATLAAVSIPAYMSYLRRSYLNEANASISAIKSAEESYFSVNNCYLAATATPSTIPAGGVATTWPTAASLASTAWASTALGVRPDRTVRFQYEVYGSNAVNTTTGGCGTAIATRPTTIGCITDAANNLVPSSVFGSNWYIVVARGDLNAGGATSNIISAIDDSKILYCNELE